MSHAGIHDRYDVIEQGRLSSIDRGAIGDVRNLRAICDVDRYAFRKNELPLHLRILSNVDLFCLDVQIPFDRTVEAHRFTDEQSTLVRARNRQGSRRRIDAICTHVITERNVLGGNRDIVRDLRMVDHDILSGSTHAVCHLHILQRNALTSSKDAAMTRSTYVDLARIEGLPCPIQIVLDIGIRNRMHNGEQIARIVGNIRFNTSSMLDPPWSNALAANAAGVQIGKQKASAKVARSAAILFLINLSFIMQARRLSIYLASSRILQQSFRENLLNTTYLVIRISSIVIFFKYSLSSTQPIPAS